MSEGTTGVVYVKVKLRLELDLDEDQVQNLVSEMDYHFSAPEIESTEIVDLEADYS